MNVPGQQRRYRSTPAAFLVTILFAVAISAHVPAQTRAQSPGATAPSEDATRTHQRASVGIAPLAQTGGPNTAAVAETVVGTLEAVLTMTGRFQPVLLNDGQTALVRPGPDDTAPGVDDYRAVADGNDLDNLITGSIATDTDGRTVIALQTYNRRDDAVTVTVTENAPSLFSVFDAVDRAVVALLEGFTGNPVAFGTLTLAGDWQPERDRIFLDGASYNVSGARIPGLLAREYQLVVTRRTSDGATTELLSRTVEIEPDGLTAVTIPLRRVTTGSVEVIAGELPANQIVFATDETAGGEGGILAEVAIPPASVSAAPRGNAVDLGQDLAGETLVIYNYPPAYDAVVAAFEEATGISVFRAPGEDPAWRLDLALQTEQPPHVAFMSQPGPAFDLLDLEIVDNLYRVFDRAYLQQFYRHDVLAFSHPDPVAYDDSDRSVGLTTVMSLKSLYWYAPSIFMMWGISEPATRSEMIRSVTQLRRASEAPYSFAIESGNSTGWMVTDWIEDRLLQTIPLQEFDAWSRGQVSFRDPVVEEAVTRTIRTIRRTGEMYGGIDGVTGRSFTETLAPLVAQPPEAGMAFGSSFLAQWYQEDLDRLGFFPTPPENPEDGTRRLVGGDVVVVVEATPAARAFIRYLNDPETARLLADSLTAEGQIGHVVAHDAAVPDWYSEPQRSFATIIRDADYLRFDASDRMNREVGMERFLTGARSMVYGSDITGTLNSIDRYRRNSLR